MYVLTDANGVSLMVPRPAFASLADEARFRALVDRQRTAGTLKSDVEI
ncbi:MAG: hypothetical protein QOK16_2341 [Solirubrobacteraceae bacterium]|jgi:hypothetical protein|nr:hypothetical protein [Solirubrobacteraceae bacterium]MEA2184071.1 hypothetical protein [Solirubrobacteraceae bacterium]MEA2187330.1 hypothetical protein [Solirubrobacteraceae bacterium]